MSVCTAWPCAAKYLSSRVTLQPPHLQNPTPKSRPGHDLPSLFPQCLPVSQCPARLASPPTACPITAGELLLTPSYIKFSALAHKKFSTREMSAIRMVTVTMTVAQGQCLAQLHPVRGQECSTNRNHSFQRYLLKECMILKFIF